MFLDNSVDKKVKNFHSRFYPRFSPCFSLLLRKLSLKYCPCQYLSTEEKIIKFPLILQKLCSLIKQSKYRVSIAILLVVELCQFSNKIAGEADNYFSIS